VPASAISGATHQRVPGRRHHAPLRGDLGGRTWAVGLRAGRSHLRQRPYRSVRRQRRTGNLLPRGSAGFRGPLRKRERRFSGAHLRLRRVDRWHRLRRLGLGARRLHPIVLLVARPAALLLSLARTGLPRPQKLFMAWFGPKGVTSMLFALFVLKSGAPDRSVVFDAAAFVIWPRSPPTGSPTRSRPAGSNGACASGTSAAGRSAPRWRPG